MSLPPVMFITYAYDDPDEAPVLDSSATLAQALKNAAESQHYGCPVYRVTKTNQTSDGLPVYSGDEFVQLTPEGRE